MDPSHRLPDRPGGDDPGPGRRLGVDVGSVRIGVACSDPDGILAVQVADNGVGLQAEGRRSGLRNLAARAEKLALRKRGPASASSKRATRSLRLPSRNRAGMTVAVRLVLLAMYGY